MKKLHNGEMIFRDEKHKLFTEYFYDLTRQQIYDRFTQLINHYNRLYFIIEITLKIY